MILANYGHARTRWEEPHQRVASRHLSVTGVWQRVLQHVAIVWVQVSQPRFLLFTLPSVLTQSLRTLAVLGNESKEVEGAADRGETHESKGEGVTLDVLGSVARQETEGSDGPPQLPRPIWKAVPTLRLGCPPTVERRRQTIKSESVIKVDSRLTLSQQRMIGRAAYPPIMDMNNAPYLTFTLS